MANLGDLSAASEGGCERAAVLLITHYRLALLYNVANFINGISQH